MPDPLSFKATTVKTDHKNAVYRTTAILWRSGQTAFGCTTAENGKATIQKVHIIGQNNKNPPQYKVPYKLHSDDEDLWIKLHKHPYPPSESLDKEQVPTIIKYSHSKKLVANFFKTAL